MLSRNIRKWDLVLLMINGIIGAGIFGLPSKIFNLSGTYSILALFVCAFVVFIIILNFAEVSSRFKKTGGPYLYTLTAFGSFPAFLMGWLMFISRIVTYAALLNLLITYLSFFSTLFNSSVFRTVAMLFITIILTIINYIGVRSSTTVNNVLTLGKLIPLALFILVGIFYINPALFKFNQTPDFPSFSSSVLLLIFAFTGFEAIIVNTGEIKNPGKLLPFALITAILLVAIFYIMIQLVSIGTFPDLLNSEKPLADAAHGFMGQAGTLLIVAGAIISIAGTLNAVMLIGSRIPFALSEEGQLPVYFSFTHSRFFTPTRSLIFFSLIAVLVSITGSFIYTATLSAITKILILLVVCLSLIRLRKVRPFDTDFFKIPHGYFFSLLGIALSIWLLLSSDIGEIRAVMIAMLVGAFIYFINERLSKSGRKKA